MISKDAWAQFEKLKIFLDDIVPPGSKNVDVWYWKNQFYPADDGEGCCSNTTIAFHYVQPKQMYVLDFFLYRVKVHTLDFF